MDQSQRGRLQEEGFLIAFDEFMNPDTFNRFTLEIFAGYPGTRTTRRSEWA